MKIITRRNWLNQLTIILPSFAGSTLLAQGPEAPRPSPSSTPSSRNSHVSNGIYYFSGTGSNDGYPKDDHVLVSDPFEKHVSRTMDALRKNLERAGSNMDSILHLDVFICLPLADTTPLPSGKARFDGHKAQYDALNKIYGTYFAPGRAPTRSCMAVEWIPGDSLIEISGAALVVGAAISPQ